MADTKLAKIGITVKEPWASGISYEVLDYTLWRVQDGGDGCGYIALRDNIGVTPDSDTATWRKATQAGQSIYDLAVKYGHFEGTEEEFEAEYQAALQAARDAASETSATNTEIQNAEALRVTAEQGRVTAEIGRVSAESQRANAEATRENNETARAAAEAVRVSNESGRVTAENGRVSAEQGRVSAESARASAETERRSTFESLKTDMETAIGQADAATAAAVALNEEVAGDEADRVTAETARTTAESGRASAESGRVSAESARVTAENARATAESGRVSAETARVSAESARETQAAADHTQAVSDHTTAASDHTQAVADHTASETATTAANTAAAAADQARENIQDDLDRKADKDGSYDTMSVGSAKNLEGRSVVTDSFLERTTGGDAEVANGLAQMTEVKGRSQVWNQLVQNGDFSDGVNNWASTGSGIAASNGVLTVTTNNNLAASSRIQQSLNTVTNHKYLVHFEIKPEKATTGRAGISSNGELYPNQRFSAGVWNKYAEIRLVNSTGGSLIYFYFNIYSALSEGDTLQYRDLYLIDLTLLFGAGNEPETVEEFEQWLAENIGLKSYYPYNAGTVLNNRMTGVESIGRNLLDPATGKARIIGAYSEVYGNYYGITGTHGALTFTSDMGETSTITPDSDGKFLLEEPGELSVADAGADCSVFIWWDGTKTDYSEFERNVAKLDVTHIYGKKNGQGSLVQVWPTGMPGIGDIKDALKIVEGVTVAERKVGEVDMGTVNWEMFANPYTTTYRQEISDKKVGIHNLLCAGFSDSSSINAYQLENMARYGSDAGAWVYLRNDSYDNDATSFRNSVSGQILYYELATPQTYTDLVYQNSELFPDSTPVTLPVNYTIDNWGIERVLPLNTSGAVVTTKPELTCKYSIDAVELLNTHTDEIADLYDGLDELDAKKPNKQGDYPGMAVGSAKTLEGNENKVEDFVFTPISAADGLAKINDVRGKSLVWNQQVGTLTTEVTLISGRKYLTRISGTAEIVNGTGQTVSGLGSTDNIIDLTLMFGAGNEPTTVAEFEKMFPLPYYAYNAGEIISNKTEAVESVGFNQWDEEWEEGLISSSTGQPITGNNVRSKNFSPCKPNTEYYYSIPSPNQLRLYWYDSNKNFISSPSASGGGIITTPDDCFFFKLLTWNSGYGSTYNHDICINLSDPSRNGQYEPYKKNTIELNLPTLTGKLNGEGESVVVFPDGLKSAGTVRDEIVGNRAIKRIGVVDMGTLNWTYHSGTSRFYVIVTDMKPTGTGYGVNGICVKYATVNVTYANMPDKSMIAGTNFASASTASVVIKDSAYSDAATFKAAMSGVMLYYELAEPVEYILDTPLPENFQAYKGGTLKQLPENTSEPTTTPMVMSVTYALDAVGILTGLPQNYVSKESLQAMLASMQSAGIFSAYTMTWDATNQRYTFSFTVSNS